MSPVDTVRSVWRGRPAWLEDHVVHALVVVLVISVATVYATVTEDHSGNVWIVYGSAIGYAAGRSGARPQAQFQQIRREIADGAQ